MQEVISNLGMNGEGVCKVNNEVIFVPFALPDETVEGIIINNKNKFSIGKVTNIVNASKFRAEPKCPYFKKCGGCALQHYEYEKQLEFKTNLVQDTLKKVGNITTNVKPCVASNLQYNYRNKASFPVVKEDGETKIGMFRVGSHNLVELNYCPLQQSKINKLLMLTKEFVNKFKISGFNEKNNSGILKHLVARELNNSLIVTLVTTTRKFPHLDEFVNILKQNFESVGLNLNINNLNNNVILSNEYVHVFGISELSCYDNEIKYQVSSASFYQVNNFIKDLIYKKVLNNIEQNSVVIDAYSGAGLLSSMISKKCNTVYGIEIVKQATENANNLKRANNITNLININGDCAEKLPILVNKIKENCNNLTIVLDPPRKGCDKKVLDAIKKVKPNKIIYVSCSPISLARDLNILMETETSLINNNLNISSESPYVIKEVEPYDMFPQTPNVETVVILEKKDAN